MMSLTLQPAITSTPIEGLPAQSQSKDSESTQPISFGEVLKVEEKKLEQETSAANIAAILATLQTPVLTEPIIGLDASIKTSAPQTSASTAPTIDPVQSAVSTLKQGTAANSAAVATRQSANTAQIAPNIRTFITGAPLNSQLETDTLEQAEAASTNNVQAANSAVNTSENVISQPKTQGSTAQSSTPKTDYVQVGQESVAPKSENWQQNTDSTQTAQTTDSEIKATRSATRINIPAAKIAKEVNVFVQKAATDASSVSQFNTPLAGIETVQTELQSQSYAPVADEGNSQQISTNPQKFSSVQSAQPEPQTPDASIEGKPSTTPAETNQTSKPSAFEKTILQDSSGTNSPTFYTAAKKTVPETIPSITATQTEPSITSHKSNLYQTDAPNAQAAQPTTDKAYTSPIIASAQTTTSQEVNLTEANQTSVNPSHDVQADTTENTPVKQDIPETQPAEGSKLKTPQGKSRINWEALAAEKSLRSRTAPPAAEALQISGSQAIQQVSQPSTTAGVVTDKAKLTYTSQQNPADKATITTIETPLPRNIFEALSAQANAIKSADARPSSSIATENSKPSTPMVEVKSSETTFPQVSASITENAQPSIAKTELQDNSAQPAKAQNAPIETEAMAEGESVPSVSISETEMQATQADPNLVSAIKSQVSARQADSPIKPEAASTYSVKATTSNPVVTRSAVVSQHENTPAQVLSESGATDQTMRPVDRPALSETQVDAPKTNTPQATNVKLQQPTKLTADQTNPPAGESSQAESFSAPKQASAATAYTKAESVQTQANEESSTVSKTVEMKPETVPAARTPQTEVDLLETWSNQPTPQVVLPKATSQNTNTSVEINTQPDSPVQTSEAPEGEQSPVAAMRSMNSIAESAPVSTPEFRTVTDPSGSVSENKVNPTKAAPQPRSASKSFGPEVNPELTAQDGTFTTTSTQPDDQTTKFESTAYSPVTVTQNENAPVVSENKLVEKVVTSETSTADEAPITSKTDVTPAETNKAPVLTTATAVEVEPALPNYRNAAQVSQRDSSETIKPATTPAEVENINENISTATSVGSQPTSTRKTFVLEEQPALTAEGSNRSTRVSEEKQPAEVETQTPSRTDAAAQPVEKLTPNENIKVASQNHETPLEGKASTEPNANVKATSSSEKQTSEIKIEHQSATTTRVPVNTPERPAEAVESRPLNNRSISPQGTPTETAARSANAVNAPAEDLFGTMSQPKVQSEAIVSGQGNVRADVQTESVESSERVGIQVDEKEVKRTVSEDVTPLANLEKGSVDIQATGKTITTPVDPTAFDIVQQITTQMKARLKNGETSIRMQLNPKELGAIEVQVTHSAQGVSVSFVAEKAATSQLIESQVSQLRQSLKDAGVQLSNLNINQHNQSNQEGGFRQSQSFVQTPRRDVPPQAEAVIEERTRTQRMDGSTGEINYLV